MRIQSTGQLNEVSHTGVSTPAIIDRGAPVQQKRAAAEARQNSKLEANGLSRSQEAENLFGRIFHIGSQPCITTAGAHSHSITFQIFPLFPTCSRNMRERVLLGNEGYQ